MSAPESASGDPTYRQQPGELVLLPAVDVQDGTAVRLVEGRAGTETAYGSPVDAARQWAEQGATWIHLVDLDAAFGRGSNRDLLAEVVRSVDVPVEVSGGIRDDDSLAAALASGAARVIIGTAALEDPDWVASVLDRHGDRVAVSLDVRGHTLAARGWTREGGDLWEALERLDGQGCARYVVTDVSKDGTMKGPNLHLLREVLERTDRRVIASGGIAHVSQLHELQELVPHGLEGAIIGKALYEGAFTLAEAIAATEPTRYFYEWNPPND
jgi:1-(5-phosphoribosyl)-5-[(5-phosphoribosylamino)methylideneamino] imidazole-4-carboxamide isomerase/N-(5'phosphoribosyl)anthranilate isomerase